MSCTSFLSRDNFTSSPRLPALPFTLILDLRKSSCSGRSQVRWGLGKVTLTQLHNVRDKHKNSHSNGGTSKCCLKNRDLKLTEDSSLPPLASQVILHSSPLANTVHEWIKMLVLTNAATSIISSSTGVAQFIENF